MSKIRIEAYVIIIRSWLCTKWDLTSKTYRYSVSEQFSGFMDKCQPYFTRLPVIRGHRRGLSYRGHYRIIPIYLGLRAFLWQSTTYLRLSILWLCRSHSWFLATWAFDITAISFWSMNNIMNNILAPLSKHMIYAGICITFNLIEKIGYSSSGRKTCTISFWVIPDYMIILGRHAYYELNENG